jgi:hypothetical protein
MATRYWVLGSGTWDTTTTTNWSTTSGGTGGASAPTSADDVIFDANSNVLTTAFTVTIPSSANCLSLSTGGAGGALDAVMTLNLSVASVSVLNVYGSFTLPATNFTWTGAGSVVLNFLSSTTGNTITTNGVVLTLTVINWNNVNGGWTLGSALTNTGNTCNFYAGSLNTGNYNVSLTQFSMVGALARTLTLGSSTLTFSASAPWTYSGSNLTLNAGTSTINCSGATATFAGGGLTYYNVGFTSTAALSLIVTGANTFNNLTIAARAGGGIGLLVFDSGLTNTINGTLTLGSGTTAVARLIVGASSVGSPTTLSVATLTAITDIDFRDITASGASAPWSGTRIGNCLGCTNITFATPRTVYWNSAASASWNGAVWSTTSGNTGGLTINFPLAQDTVVIDDAGLTAGNTITYNAAWSLGAIDFSSRTNTMTFGNGVVGPSIYGSLTLSSAVTLTGTSPFFFRNKGLTATITSAGVLFTQGITIQAVSGTVAINGNLTLSTTSAITLLNGTLDLTNGGTGNYVVSAGLFQISITSTRAIAFGTGNITVTGNADRVVSASVLTGFSYTGTPTVNLTYSGSTGTRTITHGNSGVTEANVLDIYISAGSDIITTTGTATFGTLSFAGFTGTLTRGVFTINIYRNLVFGTGMTYTAISSAFNMIGTVVPQTITGNEVVIDSPININSVGGTTNLGSALTLGATYGNFTHTNGTLNLAGYTLTSSIYTTATGTKNLTFNGGTLVCFNTTTTTFNNAAPTGFTTTAGTGTGTISMTGATAKTFVGGGSTYNCTLNQGGAGALTITGANTFNNITNTVTPATVTFPASVINNFNAFNLNGTAGNLVTINSSTVGTKATLNNIGTSLVSCDYLSIQDSNVT